MCNRHFDKPAEAHCTVCKKLICPECMSTFGYLCSINCRYQAEQQGIQVPKYKFQKRSVEAREFRKGAMITFAVAGVVLALIAAWYWYDIVGSKPKLATTIPVGAGRDVYSQFLGENKILMVSNKLASSTSKRTRMSGRPTSKTPPTQNPRQAKTPTKPIPPPQDPPLPPKKPKPSPLPSLANQQVEK